MIEIEVTSGVAEGQRVRTSAPSISIGRSQHRTIVVDDPRVSRHHGEILMLRSGYQYRDLNSAGGTLLRRGRQETFIKQAMLAPGDEIILGATENTVRITDILADPVDSGDKSMTVLHVGEDSLEPPEVVFAEDSMALRTIVEFDSRMFRGGVTTAEEVLRLLVTSIPRLFDGVDYVAAIEEHEGRPHPYDHVLLEGHARIRTSHTIMAMAAELERPFVFCVEEGGLLVTEGRTLNLSDDSLTARRDDECPKSGICVPLRVRRERPRILQLERNLNYGAFTGIDLAMVNSLAMRAVERIDNLELVRTNQLLNLNASLGVFAAMIGHDIKNYLFFGKRLSDVLDAPLRQHIGLVRGIERSRKLAQGMKDLIAPGQPKLERFHLTELAESVAAEFESLFGDSCAFTVETRLDDAEVTTSKDLLSRLVWNLIMNAYHAADNRRRSLKADPVVRIGLDGGADHVEICVEDNAGGIGPRTLEYIQRSFELVRSVYTKEEELIDVVDAMSRMEGFTNSVGLFFTAVAVNDMSGEVTVETERGHGTVFTIGLPRHVTELKRLLRF